MLLQPFSEADVVEIIKAINRITKSFVVLFFYEQVVVGIVDCL